MANQPETTTYEAGIYQLEITDPVQGGIGGASNLPLKQLANRTNWLKAAADAAATALGLRAPLDSPTLTGTPAAPTPAVGDDTTKIPTTAFVQKSGGGVASVPVGGNSNVTLTAVQWGCRTVILTGALTGNINVILPTREDEWNIVNNTTGAFAITCKTAAGTGIVVAQGKARTLWCDATNIYAGQTDLTDAALLGNATAVTPGTADSSTKVATTAMVQAAAAAAVAGSLAVPPGAVFAMAASDAPAGYLKANGALVSRATYAALFTAIGTTYGVGDGATTFALPDLRGEFVRGWDDGRGVDAGRVFGTDQAQSIQAHTHTLPSNSGNGSGAGSVEDDNGSGSPQSANTGSTGTAETRPRNVALLYVIKT